MPTDRIPICEPTRESFTVNETGSGRQYRFILPGPHLSDSEQAECLDRLRHLAPVAQFVVASGSLPPGVAEDFYQRVADVCNEAGVRLVLDSSGVGLHDLTGGVFLLTPSLRELRECLGRDLASEAEQVAAPVAAYTGRSANVVVSLGGDGALLVTSHGVQRFPSIPVPSGSGVGAGDAMVAGITAGLARGWTLDKAVQLGTAAGAAMLLTPGTAACVLADVERLLPQAAEPIVLE